MPRLPCCARSALPHHIPETASAAPPYALTPPPLSQPPATPPPTPGHGTCLPPPAPPPPPPRAMADGAASSPAGPTSPEPDPVAIAARLPADLLRSFLQRLPPADLARAACVCRAWHAVASDRAVLEAAFRAPWGVRRVVGEPSTRAFWRTAYLGRFALSHAVRRGDTVPGVALRYSVQVTDIKRFNNMISDHGIYSRERLLIPIRNPEILLGSTCYIEMDHNAKREVAVFYPEGRPGGKAESSARTVSTEKRSQKILESVRRSLRVDDGTALYYLSISEGNPRAAMVQFSEDLRWEQQRGGY